MRCKEPVKDGPISGMSRHQPMCTRAAGHTLGPHTFDVMKGAELDGFEDRINEAQQREIAEV